MIASLQKTYILNLAGAEDIRIESKLVDQERAERKRSLWLFGIPESEIDVNNTETLLDLWNTNYDTDLSFKGMTFARVSLFPTTQQNHLMGFYQKKVSFPFQTEC